MADGEVEQLDAGGRFKDDAVLKYQFGDAEVDDEEKQRLAAEAKAEEEARVKAEEEEAARVKAEEEEAARIKAEEEEAARIKAEEEEAARVKSEEEEAARVKAEEEEAARVKAEEEEAARVKAEEEEAARVKAEEEAAARARAEAKKKEEEAEPASKVEEGEERPVLVTGDMRSPKPTPDVTLSLSPSQRDMRATQSSARLGRSASVRRSAQSPRQIAHDDGIDASTADVADGTVLVEVMTAAHIPASAIPSPILLLLGGAHPAEYSGDQVSTMHELCRDGIRAAGVHAGAMLVGRCGRFDLLSVCASKAVTHPPFHENKGKGKSKRKARQAPSHGHLHSVGLLPHDEQSTTNNLSSKVYVKADSMEVAGCQVGLAAQLSGQTNVGFVEMQSSGWPAQRVVAVVGVGTSASAMAAAQQCLDRGWPVVVLEAASGPGVRPLAADERVRVFRDAPAAHLAVLLHVLLTTSS